ncbi:hypothetical protein ID850_14805 [Xenorhabdus sp. Flor]|uniref:hypothetical protein n=1 Tax=Xenorhabdus cabanillasii TaxID=351673 RepID=UPI0019C5DAF2|nr:hypothetical protein [Xenorhabdus sp. Flor]MBD2816001.1 hypothetical protein [Xenorhabdus sp. Flor]
MNIINNTGVINSSCAFGELCVSIPDGADVVIGQICYLTVSLTADSNLISSIDSISIETDTKYMTVENIPYWKISEDKNYGSAIALLHINNNLSSEISIKYTIHAMSSSGYISEIKPLEINYTTKKVEPTSFVSLTTKNEYIEPPTEDNSVGTGSSYIKYYGKLLDNNQKPLRNTQIIVSSEQPNKIFSHDNEKALVNIGTEPENGKMSQKIITQSQSNFDFFAINSDINGNIKFRVYPIRDTSVRIDFNTQILNVTSVSYAASIYIFNAISNSPFGSSPPIILGMEDGKIKKIPEAKGIEVHVSPYPRYLDTDSLIFFIQGFDPDDNPIQLKPIYNLDGISNLEENPFYFTYDQIPLNKPMKIYYLVAPENQEYSYSMAEMFTYIGEQGDHPIRDKDRIYDKVKVYSSFVTLPIKVYSEEGDIYNIMYEIYESDGVNLDTISHKRKYGQSAKGVVGLYVVIMGTNEKDNKKLPPLGSQGKLTVRVETETSRNTHNSYSFQLPSTPDPGRSTGYCVVNIPYCDVNRAGPSFTQGAGVVVFEYYIEENDGSRKYSKKWRTKIDTVLPNQSDDDPDGCDPLPDNSSYF